VTPNDFPAIRRVAVRATVPEFAVKEYVRVVPPVPLAGVTVSQEAVLEAVHEEDEGTVSVTLPLPAVAGTVAE
jgi:cytochrome P450